MKIKGFFLISLIIISSIGLSVTAFYSKDGMYSPYWGSIVDRPILSTVLTAAANGVYPWSPDSPVKVVDFGISKIFDPSLANLQKDLQGDNKLKKMDSQIGTLFFISPEILKGSYNEKCDIWSLGIILYYLLCGYPPFEGGNDGILIQQILESKIKYPKEDGKNISESAKDLINKMLCPEKKRISAKEIMYHKWFKTKLKKQLEKKITFDFDKLSKYKNFNILKKSILLFLSSILNSEESISMILKIS